MAQIKLSSNIYFPMLVPEGDGSLQANLSVWEKYDRLSPEKQDVLTSDEMALKIKGIQEQFRLSEKGVVGVSQIVRKIFFGEVDFSGAQARLASTLSQTGNDQNQAASIAGAIQREIVTLKPPKKEISPQQAVTQKSTKAPLLKALSAYPHLGDQIVTNEKIKLKTSAELVRPTLGNWIKYYRDELGIGFHEEIERGRFLFQSQNGKRLSNEERARLNLILKSIEEEFPVEIDVTRQVVVFPSGNDAMMQLVQVGQSGKSGSVAPRPMNSGKSPSFVGGGKPVFRVEQKGMSPGLQVFRPFGSGSREPEKNISGETLHFSTGHVMPAEQASPNLTKQANEALRQMQAPTQSIDREAKPPVSKSPYSIRPLRLRNDSDQSA